VVRAGLAISVVPREVAQTYASAVGLRVIGLTDAWAQRRFAICFQTEKLLNPAAALLLAHLQAVASIE
jgi:DNA-binding transcriptional LysR family regulator